MNSSANSSAHSVRTRLARISTERGVDFQQVLTTYGIERLLYRLSISRHAQQFILKGATLFTLWEGFPHRQTRDLDLLGFGDDTVERVEGLFRDIISAAVAEDGLNFDPKVRGESIRTLQEYGGIRIHLLARLEKARIVVGVDVGFGDHVIPLPREVEFPTLLDLPRPRLRAYPVEAVVAEKLQALVNLGLANSRMKDFFDLWHISQTMAFEGLELTAAVRGTFQRRNTTLPDSVPLALTQVFATNPMKESQWLGFCRKTLGSKEYPRLIDVVSRLSEFLLPVLEAAKIEPTKLRRWPAGGPWEAG